MFSSSTLSILFAIGFTAFFLGVLPLWNAISNNRPLVNDTASLLTELQGLQERKDELVKIYNSVPQDNIRKLEAVIPATPTSLDIPFLYVLFGSIAGESNFHVDTITVTPRSSTDKFSRQASGLQETAISLSGFGSYDSIKAFLQGIEGNLRLLEVQNVSIAPREKDQFTLVVVLKTFHQ